MGKLQAGSDGLLSSPGCGSLEEGLKVARTTKDSVNNGVVPYVVNHRAIIWDIQMQQETREREASCGGGSRCDRESRLLHTQRAFKK